MNRGCNIRYCYFRIKIFINISEYGFNHIRKTLSRCGSCSRQLAFSTFTIEDSAGGLIACAVATMLKDRKQILPRGVMLIYPVLDNGMNTESMKRFVDTPIWDSNCNKLFWNLYLDGCDVNKAKYATISEKVSVASFPGTYIEVAEFDSL